MGNDSVWALNLCPHTTALAEDSVPPAGSSLCCQRVGLGSGPQVTLVLGHPHKTRSEEVNPGDGSRGEGEAGPQAVGQGSGLLGSSKGQEFSSKEGATGPEDLRGCLALASPATAPGGHYIWWEQEDPVASAPPPPGSLSPPQSANI